MSSGNTLKGLFAGLLLLGGMASAQSSFDPQAALAGVQGDQATCPDDESYLWVAVDGTGDCIRYFASNLDTTAEEAFVFFHGDLPVKSKNAQARFPELYKRFDSPEKLRSRAENQRLNAEITGPYIFITRPGLFGSSGHHATRRAPREVDLMTGALDVLKRRYGIQTFHLSGQSGGGHIVAAVLPTRTDVGCAVTSSGILSVAMRAMIRNGTSDISGGYAYHDPVDHVGDLPGAPLKLIVLADPQDAISPFEAQVHYVSEALASGADVSLLTGKGKGSRRHNLGAAGRIAMRLCADGTPPHAIQDEIHGLTGAPD